MSGIHVEAAEASSGRGTPSSFSPRTRLSFARSRFPASYGARMVFLVGVYYAAAHIGYAFAFSGPVAAIVWLPVGVGIAALYLFGLGLWPAVILGDLLVNNY